MGKKNKDKKKKKTGLPSPFVIQLKELVLPTMISLALLSSILLIFATVRKDPKSNADSTVISTEDLENLVAESTEDLTGGVTELDIKTLKEGTGAEAKVGDTISVNYTGKYINGTVFDSSIERGIPFEFTLGAGGVIAGWEQGMPGMKVGEKRELTIPYSLGYGETGYATIPGKATLIFEVELLGIK